MAHGAAWGHKDTWGFMGGVPVKGSIVIPVTVTHYHIQGVYTKRRLSGWIQGRRSPSNPEYSSGRLPRYLPLWTGSQNPFIKKTPLITVRVVMGRTITLSVAPYLVPTLGRPGKRLGQHVRDTSANLLTASCAFVILSTSISIYTYICILQA